MKRIALVMCGGKGTRLHPISTEKNPKQFLPLLSDKPMIDETIDRISPIFSRDSIFICSVMEYMSKVYQRHYPSILEPMAKGTTYSFLYCVMEIIERYGDAIIHVIPSDHHIKKLDKYHKSLEQAAKKAEDFNKIVLLGVEPDKADTNYGYIKRVGHRIIDFYEKPTQEQAEYYLRTGYVWNSGHFIFKASVMLASFKVYQPEIYKGFRLFYRNRCLDAFYKDLTPVNIEKSIIEKTNNLAVIPSSFEWSDIGTIERLFEVWKGDEIKYVEKIKAYKRIDQRSRKSN